jgi:glycosyltransferase involved in cell wall biosynthesis
LGQGYEDLELLVIDGGSNDDSAAIIRSFGAKVNVFVSEPDTGQSDAINKGLARATGEIVAYVNSDDLLEPGSLGCVGDFFKEHPEAEWLAGGCRVFGEGIQEWCLRAEGWEKLIETILPWARPQRYAFPQSGASFMRRTLVERLGPYDTSLHYSMDMEYYTRAAFRGSTMHIVPETLAGWRLHVEAKSWTRGIAYAFRKDEVEILRRYLNDLPPGDRRSAEAALEAQSRSVVIREANYWARQGQRKRGFQMLIGLGLSSPTSMLRRPWLGGVRRVLLGWGEAPNGQS